MYSEAGQDRLFCPHAKKPLHNTNHTPTGRPSSRVCTCTYVTIDRNDGEADDIYLIVIDMWSQEGRSYWSIEHKNNGRRGSGKSFRCISGFSLASGNLTDLWKCEGEREGVSTIDIDRSDL